MRASSSTVIVPSGSRPGGQTSWKVSRGQEFERNRFLHDDRHPPAFQRIEQGIEEFRRFARALDAWDRDSDETTAKHDTVEARRLLGLAPKTLARGARGRAGVLPVRQPGPLSAGGPRRLGGDAPARVDRRRRHRASGSHAVSGGARTAPGACAGRYSKVIESRAAGRRAQAARSRRSRWSPAALVLCAVLLSGAAVWEDARSETISSDSYPAMAERLHEKANAMCFVARSVNFPVVHAPEIVTA